MEMTQCSIGHFYDSDEYSICPFCSSGLSASEFGTESTFDKMSFQREYELRKLKQPIPSPVSESGRAVFSAPPTGPMNSAVVEQPCVVGWLVVIEGADRGKSFELFEGKNTIGRSSKNRVCLGNDGHVSRMAASVVFDGRSCSFFCVPDPNASSMTFVNSQPLLSHSALRASDVISIGMTKLMLVPFCTKDFHW